MGTKFTQTLHETLSAGERQELNTKIADAIKYWFIVNKLQAPAPYLSDAEEV